MAASVQEVVEEKDSEWDLDYLNIYGREKNCVW